MQDILETYVPEVKTIIEAGACDCADSLVMVTDHPQAHVYAFECNPETIALCRKVDSEQITLIEKAVSDIDGELTFYPIDTKLTVTTHKNGNPGASSLFKVGDYPVEKYVQKEIKVESVRLDTFMAQNNVSEVDLLWLDAQGAELQILRGLGSRLKDVKIIKTEVLFKPQYIGAPLFEEVEEWLDQNGFRFVRFLEKYEWFGDAVFVNKNL